MYSTDDHSIIDKRNPDWAKHLKRVERLLGTDEGFYSLALHSFIECYIDTVCEEARWRNNFPDKMDEFEYALQGEEHTSRDWYKILTKVVKDHNITNGVRHSFRQLSAEEATAITYNFLNFCTLVGLDHLDVLSRFRENIEEVWTEKMSPLEQRKELKRLEFSVFMEQKKNRQYAKQLQQMEAAEQRRRDLQRQLEQLEKEAREKGEKAERNRQKADKARSERFQLEQRLKEARKKEEEYAPLREYLHFLERLSNYSRTRRDYERSLIKLTPEQEEVLGKIRLNHDYLVKGSAGTGKTLVLLKAFGKALKAMKNEFDFSGDENPRSEREHTVLLTYTRTLVRYNQYLAEIMNEQEIENNIKTSESFFLRKLKYIDPRYEVDYDVMEKLSKEFNTTDFLSDRELLTEIEDFIFAGAVSEEEYIDKRIPRTGLKMPLNNRQRGEVWTIARQIAARMNEKMVFSKSYSRLKILQYLREHPEDQAIRDVSFVFLDEAQDLTAVELMTLKALARRPIIMAGDIDQSIYGFSSPYSRAGIKLQGRSTILKLNFRNTVAIHQFAEHYRSLSGESRDNEGQVGEAFREGPIPEMIQSRDKAELIDSLMAKVDLFIRHLGYDPENLSILAPTKKDLEKLNDELAQRGYEAENIKDPEFAFTHEQIIRLSTLHSSKGVDFPVVLLYLPSLPPMKDVDESTLDRMYRNLLYVASTRAMDHLIIAVKDDSRHAPLQDLMRAHGELENYLQESQN